MENLTDKQNSWNYPQRQSPAAIIILLGSTFVGLLKIFWPVLVLVVFRSKPKDDEGYWGERIVWLALVLSCITIGATLINFLFFKFHLKGNNLILQSGWIKKKLVTIPLQNIQSVNLSQNVWQRVLNVVQLSIDSAGSESTEAKIEALSVNRAEELKAILLSQVQIIQPAIGEDVVMRKMQTKLSTSDLFKFSLTANHLEAFFILVGLGLNLIDNLKDAFKFDSWGIMESVAMQLAGQTAVFIGILIVVIALISVLVSIIRTFIRYYDFTIEDVKQGWKITYGLLNHQEKIIPSNKIQILSWNANWLRRKVDFWILNVQAIGHTTTKRKQQLKIPITSLKGVLSLSPVYQKSPVFDFNNAMRIEPDYWKRKTLMSAFTLALMAGLIFYFWLGIGAISILLLAIYLGWYFNKWYKVFRWQINEEGLQLYSGVWGRKFTLLTWKKVQQVQLHQSLYQQNNQLATIVFHTAGGKVTLPYIQLSTATSLTNIALFYVESRDENWM